MAGSETRVFAGVSWESFVDVVNHDLRDEGMVPLKTSSFFYVLTPNGIKVEIKENSYSIGHSNSEEDWERIKYALSENDFTFQKQHKEILNYDHEEDVLEGFIRMVDTVKHLEIDQKNTTKPRSMKSIMFDENYAYSKGARVIRFAKNEGLPDIASRIGGIADRLRNIITLGYTTEGKRAYDNDEEVVREHVVSCQHIINEAARMIDEGKQDIDVAIMIQQNLFIVIVSKTEANELTRIGLKDHMPDGWAFGGDMLARLWKIGATISE